MGRDHSQSELVRTFAATEGLALRTAQLHAQRNSERWQSFLRTRAAGLPAAAPSAPMPQPDEPVSAGTPEEEMERSAFASWQIIHREKTLAARAKDINLVSICKAEQVAQKSWREAKRANEAAKVAAGSLIPASQVAEIRRRLLIPLRAVMRNMPAEIAPKANPLEPSYALAAAESWLRTRFEPQLDAALRGLADDTEQA